MIAVVDYGMGNLRSVEQALRHVAPDANVVVTSDPSVIANAARVVFPGQGAMPDCMRELDSRNLREAVLQAACSKPFLGICIGLQMLFEHSAEGDVAGLGLLRGKVSRFAHGLQDAQGHRLKVPHMGWNQVRQVVSECALPHPNPLPVGEGTIVASSIKATFDKHALWTGIEQGARFYYVHSYFVQPDDASLVQATSDYPQPFVCAVAQENLFAVQFHPEKSHTAGLQLLHNFTKWNP